MITGERKAYVVLVIISFILTLGGVGYGIVRDDIIEQKFCSLIIASVPVTVPAPINPKANPSREKLYESFILVDTLGHSLGCSGLPPIK